MVCNGGSTVVEHLTHSLRTGGSNSATDTFIAYAKMKDQLWLASGGRTVVEHKSWLASGGFIAVEHSSQCYDQWFESCHWH